MKRPSSTTTRTAILFVALPLLLGLLSGMATSAYLRSRPAEYQARLALVARPEAATATSAKVDFIALVSANLPAVVDLAKTRDILTGATTDAGLPEQPDLAGRVSAEVVPSSAVVRIAVTDRDPARAEQLVTAIAGRVARSDLFSGTARLEPVDASRAVARQTAPDLRWATGLSLISAVLVTLALMTAMILFYPRVFSAAQVRRRLGDESLPVVQLGLDGSESEALSAVLSSGSVRIVPVDGVTARELDQLHARARKGSMIGTMADEGASGPWILAATTGTTSMRSLHNALEVARRAGNQLVAIGLVDRSARP